MFFLKCARFKKLTGCPEKQVEVKEQVQVRVLGQFNLKKKTYSKMNKYLFDTSTKKVDSFYQLSTKQLVLFCETKIIDSFHITMLNNLARRVRCNFQNKDILYNNYGCDRDLLTNTYTNPLCMEKITSKKKCDSYCATIFVNIVHPGSVLDVCGAKLRFCDI